MKNLIFLTLMLIGTTTFSQNKYAKTSLHVDGVCGMCKARIEKACLSTKGVKHAQWSIETQELKLVFDERKTDTIAIKNKVLAAGHDIEEQKAPNQAYASLHACCKYRDEDVKDAHSNAD